MDELKDYAKNNIPVECYMLRGQYKRTIFLDENASFVHLYLNNYLQYYGIVGYIFDREQFNELQKNVCFNCRNRNAMFDGCTYIKEGDGCKNYKEEPIGFLTKLINKITSKC